MPAGHRPARRPVPEAHRLIAGLADAVVIVEAPEKSGALITATAALDQGKDVMVVPGRVAGQRNRGGHLLIRDGAKIVESADDILQEMGWSPAARGSEECPEVIEFTVDDAVRETGWTPAAVLARLAELELAGQVRRVGAARFVRPGGRMLT
ncbi:MAG: DNA-processing protein DprA [Vicinamibacterales bacterium]